MMRQLPGALISQEVLSFSVWKGFRESLVVYAGQVLSDLSPISKQ